MKSVIINENQKGLLFKNGKFVKLLHSGKSRVGRGCNVEVVEMNAPLHSKTCHVDTLLKNEEIASLTVTYEIGDEELGLLYVNGVFNTAISKGKYVFWNVIDRYEVQVIDVSSPAVDESIPRHIFSRMGSAHFIRVDVRAYERARLYFNKRLVSVLEPGTYYFWKCAVSVEYDVIDTRLTRLDVTGQELLTKDKVALRVSFVTSYRITDFEKVASEVNDHEEQIHIAAQLALRDFVGRYTLDEILEMKEEMSSYVTERLKKKESMLFVEIGESGVKDIILPGAIREIMNTVLIAEKRAQANVITRREEVASTRSLLNTAKLMDENKTLYRLKELEYIERISENVGNINVSGSGDLLTQLTSILRPN